MSEEHLERPRIRPLQAVKVTREGREFIAINDQSRFSEETLLLSPAALFILQLCDGSRAIVDIQTEYNRRFGELLRRDDILELLRSLDQRFMLEGGLYEAELERRRASFVERPTRAAGMAGAAYPDEPEALSAMIRGFADEDHAAAQPGAGALRGLIAPHIDFQRGGPAYARAYSALDPEPPDLAIVLGTLHQHADTQFALTDKDYETPLGAVAADREAARELVELVGYDLLEDQYSHKDEHSIEFQAVMLAHCFAGRPGLKILPILCNGFQPWMASGLDPDEDPNLEAFIQALRRVMDRRARTLVIAGADLAHVGAQFGGEPLTRAGFDEVMDRDRAMLESAARTDSRAFYRYVADEQDRRSICGLPPIWVLLRLLAGTEGRILSHDAWADYDLGSMVSFCAMEFRAG